MRLNLTVQGRDRVIADVRSYKFERLDRVKRAVNRTAARVERGAKRRAPVDDGRLRSSIHMRPFRGSDYDIEVGTNVFYAVYQEYGTGIYAVNGNGRKTPWSFVHPKTGELWVNFRGAKPQPFLMPAFEDARPDFVNELRNALRG